MIHYGVRFAQPWILWWLIPTMMLAVLWRLFFYRKVYYRYSMAHVIASAGHASSAWHEHLLWGARLAILCMLALLCAKPQLVDKRSSITVEGIDIMLVLDVSGSMQYRDHADDQRTRIEIAKDEAIRFIEKRNNDAVGLVIFGNAAVSRVPLTLDKTMLKSVVKDIQLGIIDYNGTLLSTALVTACNRLKHSKSASKVIIILTDGAPSEGDIDPSVAVEIAKKLGIRIYTVGIGAEGDQVAFDPLYGQVIAMGVNRPLLTRIAHDTGGKFFIARNAKDMRTIYETIDQLEKTKIQAPLFSKYYDIFEPFVWFIAIVLLLELLFLTSWWFGL